MYPFFKVFPDVAERETRVLHTINHPELPPDRFGFIELYCLDPACDCRRVMINVYRGEPPVHVATINHAFDPQPDDEMGQTYPDPLNRQSDLSKPLLRAFLEQIKTDRAYLARLKRHYAMVKEAARDPSHPIQAEVLGEKQGLDKTVASMLPRKRLQPRIGRNDPCPCGSGRKYKKCCLLKESADPPGPG